MRVPDNDGLAVSHDWLLRFVELRIGDPVNGAHGHSSSAASATALMRPRNCNSIRIDSNRLARTKASFPDDPE